MPRFREEFKALFHLSDAESISLAESNTISAITASTPYSGRPMGVVNEIALVVLTMLEAAVLDTAALDTTLVSTSLYKLLQYLRLYQ